MEATAFDSLERKMKSSNQDKSRSKIILAGWLVSGLMTLSLAGCTGKAYIAPVQVVQVGTSTAVDSNLPAEPSLPTDAQVCSTLYASDSLIARVDGSLPPEADPTVSGVGKAASATTTNPDQARIQAALNACGASVDAEVGALIAADDAAAVAVQTAAAVTNVYLWPVG